MAGALSVTRNYKLFFLVVSKSYGLIELFDIQTLK